jgi:hypothetical protein
MPMTERDAWKALEAEISKCKGCTPQFEWLLSRLVRLGRQEGTW